MTIPTSLSCCGKKLHHFIGGDVTIVHDGAACLEMVRNDPPDLLLLDICMPVSTALRSADC